MKGVRYVFPDGLIVEFTHTDSCIQPAEAWIEAHKKAAITARVEEFECDVPVDRTIYPNGVVENNLLKGR